uniref:Uncharacterized protein n=1 Tax=Strongyloides venezuelensis TaxID=75913 RepID=A0A0K0FR25_STRVS
MIFSNFIKHCIILILFISLLELVEFTFSLDTSPVRRNGERYSSSSSDRSSSRRRSQSRSRNRRRNGNRHGRNQHRHRTRGRSRNRLQDIYRRGPTYYRFTFN